MQNLHYAIDENGQTANINTVSNGLSCNCICACCGSRMVAKQGNIKQWHFAHEGGKDCLYGYESSLHLLAKEILSKMTKIRLPTSTSLLFYYHNFNEVFDVGFGSNLPPKLSQDWLLHRQWGKITFEDVYIDKVEVEQSLEGYKPDLIVHTEDGTELLIEIAVTHFVDKDKTLKVKRAGKNMIEVDLSTMDKSMNNEQELYTFFESGEFLKHCKWINRSMADDLLMDKDITLQDLYSSYEFNKIRRDAEVQKLISERAKYFNPLFNKIVKKLNYKNLYTRFLIDSFKHFKANDIHYFDPASPVISRFIRRCLRINSCIIELDKAGLFDICRPCILCMNENGDIYWAESKKGIACDYKECSPKQMNLIVKLYLGKHTKLYERYRALFSIEVASYLISQKLNKIWNCVIYNKGKQEKMQLFLPKNLKIGDIYILHEDEFCHEQDIVITRVDYENSKVEASIPHT